MVVKCKKGKPRFRFRDIMGGKQRLTFCGDEIVEVMNFFDDE